MFSEWEVTCNECDDTWTFVTEDEAIEFYNEHSKFTDHEANNISELEEEHKELKNLKRLIWVLQRKGNFEEGVPMGVVYDHLNDLGVDKAWASREIEQLKQIGEIYEPSTDHLRSV